MEGGCGPPRIGAVVRSIPRWGAEVLCRRSDGWPGVRSVARMRSQGWCRSRPRSRPKTGCPCRLPSAENARSFAPGVVLTQKMLRHCW